MNKITLLHLSILFSLSCVFISCDKDDDKDPDPIPAVPAKMTIKMDHQAGSDKFYLDSTYTNANGDDFTPDLFKYYISNIRLIRNDNYEYSIPNTYFLINHDQPASMTLTLNNLMTGAYKSIKFMLGVDSTRNVNGSQTGALDPGNGMFWDWNTGYIFFKLEGTSPAIPGAFVYHVGGFSGANVNYREISIDFDGDLLQVAQNKDPELHMVTDVLELFQNPTTINMATFPANVISANAAATTLANNYADLFRYDHIHNK